MNIDYSGSAFRYPKRGNSCNSVKFVKDYDNICPLDAAELLIK